MAKTKSAVRVRPLYDRVLVRRLEGEETWNWLLKDPSAVLATAGEGTPERLVSDASLRSADASQTAADGFVAAAGLTTLAGTLWVPGAPAVMVGAAIEIAEAPHETLGGSSLVRRVCHRYDKRTGFTTRIDFSKTGEGGLGALGGLL